jgi:hypothetical protein
MNKYFILLILVALFLFGCRSSILDDPTTTIDYYIPETSHVKLTIENNYNSQVAILVDEIQPEGRNSVTFDASGLLEGVYFYTIECRSIESNYYSKTTKKMLLIK